MELPDSEAELAISDSGGSSNLIGIMLCFDTHIFKEIGSLQASN